MKKLIIAFIVFLSFGQMSAQSQTYQKKLLKDIVVIADSKMTSNDLTLLTMSNGSTLQIKSHAEAPSLGLISRDNFVAMFTSLSTTMIDEIKKSDSNATTKDLDEIIGNPDVEINIYMAKGGIQVETKSSAGTERMTMQWEDVFK